MAHRGGARASGAAGPGGLVYAVDIQPEMLAHIVRALKPGGYIIFVEFKGEDGAVPIRRLQKMTEARVRTEAAVHGLRGVRTVGTLPWQHAVGLTPS